MLNLDISLILPVICLIHCMPIYEETEALQHVASVTTELELVLSVDLKYKTAAY